MPIDVAESFGRLVTSITRGIAGPT
jgi:hypothetical protein